jgi:hypothetical protein
MSHLGECHWGLRHAKEEKHAAACGDLAGKAAPRASRQAFASKGVRVLARASASRSLAAAKRKPLMRQRHPPRCFLDRPARSHPVRRGASSSWGT